MPEETNNIQAHSPRSSRGKARYSGGSRRKAGVAGSPCGKARARCFRPENFPSDRRAQGCGEAVGRASKSKYGASRLQARFGQAVAAGKDSGRFPERRIGGGGFSRGGGSRGVCRDDSYGRLAARFCVLNRNFSEQARVCACLFLAEDL